jgi:hypothetical protein
LAAAFSRRFTSTCIDPNTTPQPFGDLPDSRQRNRQGFPVGLGCACLTSMASHRQPRRLRQSRRRPSLCRFVGWEDTYTIAQATLKDFSYGCQGNPADPDPILATLLGDGTLRLNIGPYAADRVYGNTSDVDENVEVSHLEPVAGDPAGTERVRVQMFGYSQDFVGVTKVYAEGGGGTASAVPPTASSTTPSSSMAMSAFRPRFMAISIRSCIRQSGLWR